MTLDQVCQVAIPILGGLGYFLVARQNKWGIVVILTSQPFWLYSTITARQWGAVALSIFYVGTSIYGIDKWFFEGRYWKWAKKRMVALYYFIDGPYV